MIDADRCKAVWALHQEGMGLRELSRRLRLGRNTIRRIIRRQGLPPAPPGGARVALDAERLQALYTECGGRAQRMHEKLVEEEGVTVSYPTLTRRLRELGIGKPAKTRCDQVPDAPGAELQHDTTVYTIELDGKPTRLVASVLYLRYSKRRYLKFSRGFTRFKMKGFLHEALTFWGYAAPVCIIDNTNLARLRGSGATALIVPEMERFGATYGVRFVCHALRHPNRKAGEERSFYTVQTNFLPGRTFWSLEDLNAQAFEWATVRMEHRPQGKARLIPAVAFEHERGYLIELPGPLPAPYQAHERATDQYGYAAFEGNYYWVPGTGREAVNVLQYADMLKIYRARECLAEYPLPPDGVRNAKFAPPGQPQPRHNPSNRRHPTEEEEKRLRAMGESVGRYLDFALKPKGIERHRFLRRLYALSRELSAAVFIQTLERALRYGIAELDTLRSIARLYLVDGSARPLPAADLDEGFRTRDAYLEGRLTDAPDFSRYDKILEDSDHE
jgi:transposase